MTGTVTSNTIPSTTPTGSLPPWPFFAEDEIEAAAEALRSGKANYWTGKICRQFENAFATAVGCEYGIALANGTLALELALKMLGVGAGDEVVVTPRSFIASASCVVTCGATPVFADVDRVSGNITAETIENVISPRTKAIIPVHLAGRPCEMDPIMDLASKHGLVVIEDCAQAHGAVYKGRPCGSIGHAGAWSFCQDKIMTTGGEGGLLTTNDADLWERSWSYKDHGKGYEISHLTGQPLGFKWLHESFGTNWRLTEMQAAIGLAQLSKLSSWVQRRRENAAVLSEAFQKIPAIRVPDQPEHIYNSFYKYYVYVRPELLKEGWSRDSCLEDIAAQGYPGLSGICPEIYLEKAFAEAGIGPSQRLPVARELGETSMMFLVHPTISPEQAGQVAEAVMRTMEKAS